MKAILLTLIFLCTGFTSSAQEVSLSRNDALTVIVGTYVNGFKEFDTSVIIIEGTSTIRVAVYRDSTTQELAKAESLADRFRVQIPKMISKYDWATDIDLTVTVYSEDRSGRGY